MRKAAVLAVALLSTGTALAGDCGHTAPHRLTALAGDATAVVIVGRAGALRVSGATARNVVVRGTACSSDRDFLGEMRIEARRDGTELRIEAVIPEQVTLFGFHHARLDFEVEVPDSLPVRIKDGSGETAVRNVAAVDIDDGSGEIRIRDVRGDVRVHDGSGSVEITGVGGSVRVSDGSGSLDIRDVGRDVTIEDDGSGSIAVAGVRGNFTVLRDGSGGIDYERISGKVTVP